MSCPHVWPTIEPNWSKPPWRIIVIHILIIFFPVFLGCTSFPPDLSLNNFYCDINLHQVIGSCLHLFCIVIPIIGSATSVNLKKTGMASRNTVMKKQYSSCILISFAVVFGLLVFGSSYFGWLDLFSRDLTFIAGSSSTVFAVNLIPLLWPTNNFFNKSYSKTDNLKKMKITNSVCETNLNREWRADFEFDQGGRILQWENLKSRLATPSRL